MPPHMTPDGERLKLKARDNMLALIKKTLFITGLRESIRQELLKQEVDTWQEALTAAERIEAAEPVKRSPPGKIICATEETEEDQEQVSAAREQRGRGRGRGGRGRGSSRGGANGRPNWLRDNMLPPGTCYRCGHQGHNRGDWEADATLAEQVCASVIGCYGGLLGRRQSRISPSGSPPTSCCATCR